MVRIARTITTKCTLAVMLLAFAMMSLGVTMPCFKGMPAEPAAPVAKTHSCCPEPGPKPKPKPKAPKCCCIDNLAKTIAEFNVGKAVQTSLDFPILPPPTIRFELASAPIVVEQVQWPEVHGPPGIVSRLESPRAPPAA